MTANIVSWKPNFIPIESNAFVGLFRSKSEASEKAKQTKEVYLSTMFKINQLIEDICHMTLNSNSDKNLVFLSLLAKTNVGQTWLDLDLLDAALFQRLYANPTDENLGRPQALIFLCQCYMR